MDLREDIRDGVATLTLDRPDSLNAITDAMIEALDAALDRLGRDPAVGAIVLTGAGRAFCAGGDVKGMKGNASTLTPEERIENLRAKHRTVLKLHEVPKVTIAAINGAAAGAGLCLALACDFRIAARSAKLTTSFVKVGFAGDFGGIWFLTRLVGGARARELYLLSEKIGAERALELGLVGRVVDDAALADETLGLARTFATGPRLAYGYVKRNARIAETGSLAETLDSEAINQIRLANSADHTEAIAAFREGRAPVFTGR